MTSGVKADPNLRRLGRNGEAVGLLDPLGLALHPIPHIAAKGLKPLQLAAGDVEDVVDANPPRDDALAQDEVEGVPVKGRC